MAARLRLKKMPMTNAAVRIHVSIHLLYIEKERKYDEKNEYSGVASYIAKSVQTLIKAEHI